MLSSNYKSRLQVQENIESKLSTEIPIPFIEYRTQQSKLTVSEQIPKKLHYEEQLTVVNIIREEQKIDPTFKNTVKREYSSIYLANIFS